MFFSSYLTQNTNKTNTLLQPTHTFESLLKWINNIEYPRCLLASQRDDFNDGIILCELVNEIILKNQKPDFLPKINNITPNYHEKLENFDMALQIIQSNKDYPCSEEIGKLTSNDLISDNSKILIILEHMYRISNPSQDTPSSKNERSPSDQQSGISRPSNHQRQLTAEFGFKLDDVPLLQVPDHENSPKAAPSKPPKDPKLMFSKITKGAHSLSQSIRQSPQPRSSSPNKFEFQSTRDTPLKDDHMHHNSSYQSSPANSSLNKRMQYKQDSLRLSPKLDPHLSLSRISPNSEMNNSVTTVNTFFKKEIPLRPASSTSKASIPQIGCNSTRRNMHQTPVLGLRHPQMIENSGAEPLLSISSARHIKTKSSENLNFLSSSRQENRSQIIPPSKARGAGSPSMGRSNSLASISQKGRGVEKKEDIPPYASIITRSNSMSETFRSSSKENKGSGREGSPLSRRSSMRNEEKVEDLVTPVTAEIKAKILDWLLSINILKDSIPDLDKKLHKICKNGLIFVDLLNRLEGRQDVIKGITRDDSKMNIKINYLKIANYLQGFEKMNPRYLSAQEYLMGGDENVFWGFLDDIYNLYHKKISPYDTRYKKNQNKTDRPQTPEAKNTRQSVGNQREKSFRHEKSGDYTRDNKILRDSIRQDCSYLSKDRKSWVSPKDANSINSKFSKLNLEESKFASNNYSSIRTNGRESQFYSQRHHDGNGKENDPVKEICKGLDTPSKRLTPTESYSNIHSRKASACYSGRSSPSNVRRSRASQEDLSKLFLLSESKQENQKSGRPRSRSRSQIEEEENIITTDVENEVLEWLDVQGFSTIILKQQSSLFEDRLRNGSILCKVIANFEGENISPIYGQPKSIDECRYNIYTAFKVLGKKGTPIPSYLKGKEEAILKGNRNILFTLLHSLKKIYTERQNEDKSRIFEPEATFKTSNYMPPYSEQQIKLLEDSLVNWLRSLGLLESKLPRIKSFGGVISHLKDGLLLCDLVSLVLQKKVSPIHAKPNTEPQSISNIRKALEELRKVKDMGQRFLWKDKEIYDGDRFIALGLLEDINRYFHGLKARCPPNYFCEDPYIPEVLRDKKDTNDNEHESSVVNYRKYLANLKNGQSQLTRSSTCPKTRMSYDNKILVNKQDEYNENQIVSSQRTSMQMKERPGVNTFVKNGLGNRFFGNEPTNITPELTFSSPFLEGSQLDEYLPKPIPYPKRS